MLLLLSSFTDEKTEAEKPLPSITQLVSNPGRGQAVSPRAPDGPDQGQSLTVPTHVTPGKLLTPTLEENDKWGRDPFKEHLGEAVGGLLWERTTFTERTPAQPTCRDRGIHLCRQRESAQTKPDKLNTHWAAQRP